MIDQLAKAVVRWGYDKEILGNTTPQAQLAKAIEELGEVAGAVNKNNREQVKKEIGDVIVTQILLATTYDLDLCECLSTAYDSIKNRTGVVRDGVLVKEGD